MNLDTFDREERYRDYKEKCRDEINLQSYLRIDPLRPGILECREFIARLLDLTKKNNCSLRLDAGARSSCNIVPSFMRLSIPDSRDQISINSRWILMQSQQALGL
jgi:hypothetical protein